MEISVAEIANTRNLANYKHNLIFLVVYCQSSIFSGLTMELKLYYCNEKNQYNQHFLLDRGKL